MDLHEWSRAYGYAARDEGWGLSRSHSAILLISTDDDPDDEAVRRHVAEAAGAGASHAYHACEVLRDDYRLSGMGDWPAMAVSLRIHLGQVQAELERQDTT